MSHQCWSLQSTHGYQFQEKEGGVGRGTGDLGWGSGVGGMRLGCQGGGVGGGGAKAITRRDLKKGTKRRKVEKKE